MELWTVTGSSENCRMMSVTTPIVVALTGKALDENEDLLEILFRAAKLLEPSAPAPGQTGLATQ